MFPTRISFDQAHAIIERVAQAHRMPVERIALARAHGHVLASEVVAGIAQPPFDNSAMDGFALRHADLHGEEETTLQLVGEQFAGHTLELGVDRSEEHKSELQSLMRISYAVFCLKKKTTNNK